MTCKAVHVHFTHCKVNFLNIMNDTLRTVDFQIVNERYARDFEAHLLFGNPSFSMKIRDFEAHLLFENPVKRNTFTAFSLIKSRYIEDF